MLVNATTGEVRSRVVPDVTAASLAKVIAAHVDAPGSVLYTDAALAYRAIRQFVAHEFVTHEEDEYLRGT